MKEVENGPQNRRVGDKRRAGGGRLNNDRMIRD
jgi:hypothetical protein